MFKLTRTFMIAAAVSSSVLCAPVPQDIGKPISTGQAADPSASASSVFGTTPQNPNYQSHPTSLCIVPSLAKDAGLSQGQEKLNVQQAIQLCPDASTIAVSSKSSKRSTKAPDVVPPAPSPSPEPHPEAPHPARSVDDHPLKDDVPPKPATSPLLGAPQPHGVRDVPPQPSPVPKPSPEPVPATPQPHGARDLPPQPELVPPPSPSPVPQPGHDAHHAWSNAEQPPKDVIPPHSSPKPESLPVPQPDAPQRVTARSEGEHRPNPQAPPQPSAQPEPQPGSPKPVTARSAPKDEVPPHAQPLPATLPRPSQLV